MPFGFEISEKPIAYVLTAYGVFCPGFRLMAYSLRRRLSRLPTAQLIGFTRDRRSSQHTSRHRRWHVYRLLRQRRWRSQGGKRDAAVCGELPERLDAEHGVLNWASLSMTP